MSDYNHADRLLSQGEVEQQIMALSRALEDETDRYARLGELAATTEMDYRHGWALAILNPIIEGTEKVTVDLRDAYATRHTFDAQKLYRIQAARHDASKQALLSLRTRLDALRTLAANIRAQT